MPIYRETPITLPKTTRQTYLGGHAALNVLSENGTGDWHVHDSFYIDKKKPAKSFISGDGCLTNTNHLLGDEGIFDCSSVLKQMKIPFEGESAFAANHARATADLVLSAVLDSYSPNHVVLDDWMPRPSDKQQVFDLLAKALPKLIAEHQLVVMQWIERNPLDGDSY